MIVIMRIKQKAKGVDGCTEVKIITCKADRIEIREDVDVIIDISGEEIE